MTLRSRTSRRKSIAEARIFVLISTAPATSWAREAKER